MKARKKLAILWFMFAAGTGILWGVHISGLVSFLSVVLTVTAIILFVLITVWSVDRILED